MLFVWLIEPYVHLQTKTETKPILEISVGANQEAKIHTLLEHPNIIQITNFIEQDANFFLVMEFVEGESLEDLIKRKGRLNDDEAIKIIIDVLRGLQHAHGLGIIHRDIKPSNIMITKEGTAKIMDFGIAMMRDDVQHAKGTAGTIQYMSPEQINRPKDDKLIHWMPTKYFFINPISKNFRISHQKFRPSQN